jgi:hypothetical protein
VAIEVAIALAVSWNPLVKSNAVAGDLAPDPVRRRERGRRVLARELDLQDRQPLQRALVDVELQRDATIRLA